MAAMTSHPATLFSISTGSPEPIYRQLIDQLRRLIAAGQLAPGDVLPSVRDMAQALALNPANNKAQLFLRLAEQQEGLLNAV